VRPLSDEQTARVRRLSLEQLSALSDALVEFHDASHLDAWLAGPGAAD
jgi:hypothetical protein